MEPERLFKTVLPELILASQSIARRDLLESLGCIVHVSPTHGDEYHGGKVGREVVRELAERKLDRYLAKNPTPTIPVLAADTLICCDGHLVGKAANIDEARYHMELFNDRSHQVCSGFALYLPDRTDLITGSDEAVVTFRRLESEEIESYVRGDDWKGAAGSYRIQGEAKRFITGISGDMSTVVGLPIQAISAILSAPGSL